ncbi:MAG TPA: BMP family ABC transporter substrate-binding protein [Candidatus Fimenecus excrementavium]|jgi:basic membrane protein A|nr:BMP family ABC transporter substrate-binding protein [Candidatus Fimenecus excrementavium]
MKKVLSILLALVMVVLCFAACGNTQDADQGDKTQTATIAAIPKDQLKIGVIHIGDPADGSGYSYTHDLGIQGMQKNLGLSDDQIVRQLNISDSDTTAIRNAIEDCIAQGCNVIFGTSYGYMDTMEALANEHPDVIFSHGTGYKSNGSNLNNYFGRIYQARYLAGIAAGLKTKTNKIGYVSAYGTELAETCSGINAFALGVQSVNPDAVVYVKELKSWFDPANETAYAEALINMGCDVISQHCDTANPQIAAEKAGVFGCGYNSDMTKDAPKAHLTATIWNWDVYYTAAVQAVIDGKWVEFGNYYKGVKEGLCDVSPLSDNCVPGTQEKIDAVKALYNDGSWDVFTGVKLSFDENNNVVKTDAALKDNTGKEIVPAGGPSVEDSVITGSMNYFVEGVEVA